MLPEEVTAKAEELGLEAKKRGFVHNLDQMYKKLGYANKQKVVALLRRTFVEDEDWIMYRALSSNTPDLYYLTQSSLEKMLVISRSRQLNKVQLNISVSSSTLTMGQTI